MKHKPYGPYEKYIKRPLDCVLATGALVLLSPVMGVTAVLVRKKMGAPVVFTQDRPGKDENIFKLMKFRTMNDARDEKGELLPDADRLTPLGDFLRSICYSKILLQRGFAHQNFSVTSRACPYVCDLVLLYKLSDIPER